LNAIQALSQLSYGPTFGRKERTVQQLISFYSDLTSNIWTNADPDTISYN
jgi:hypothetical protein